MKQQTIALLDMYSKAGTLSQLSAAEISEIVNIEYGQTIQDVVQLFQCILRKYERLYV